MTENQSLHTEQGLFASIAEGDTGAFRELFDLYLPQIQPVVAGIVDNQAAVKDVLQDIFLLLWVDRAKLAGVDVPRNWIFRITYYHCYKYLRQQSVCTKAQQRLLDEAKEEPLGNSTEEYTGLRGNLAAGAAGGHWTAAAGTEDLPAAPETGHEHRGYYRKAEFIPRLSRTHSPVPCTASGTTWKKTGCHTHFPDRLLALLKFIFTSIGTI